MLDQVKRFITLQHAKFRQVFLIIIPVAVVLIFLAASIDLFGQGSGLGTKFALAAILLLLGVLVEHVTSNTARFQTLEGSVNNLETNVAEIRTSMGVRESIEIYKSDHAASRKQRESSLPARSLKKRSYASTVLTQSIAY